MELNGLRYDPTITPIIFVSGVALVTSLLSLLLSVLHWSKAFRPIVTAMVKTYSSGNIGIVFELVILNSGSIPARNIRLYAIESYIFNALGKDSCDAKKKQWLSCFDPKSTIAILHNNSNLKCAFGTSKANDEGFWKYKALIPITIEYEGWFGKKYVEEQYIQIIDSESFTNYQWH